MSKSRFDQNVADTFLIAVRAGAGDEVAAMHAGVDLAVARDWLRADTPATKKFAASVNKARADLHLLAVGQLRRNMVDDKAAALYLAQSMEADLELQRLRDLTL